MEEMAVASQLSPNFRDAAAYNHYFVARQLDDLNPEGAISEYIKSTEASPDLPPVWNNMGICYQAIDRHEDAYTCLKHTLTLVNNNLLYCGNLATTCLHLARYDEGIEWSKWAVSLYDPTRHTKEEGAEAYSWLFELLFEKGTANGVDPIILEEAYQAISNAYALNPNESRHDL